MVAPHNHHMAHTLAQEVDGFDRVVRRTAGFSEDEVVVCGAGDQSKRILSTYCAVPDGGIPFDINGTERRFDSAEHLALFLEHGAQSNVDRWASGGVMSTFEGVFGEEVGSSMKEKNGADMVGIIPHLLIAPSRENLRSAHGIALRGSRDENAGTYNFWRPILHAKFAQGTVAREALLSTGMMYLVERGGGTSTDMDGRINYPTPRHGDGVDGCTCQGPKPSKGCPLVRAYNQQKRDGKRENGELVGKNKMGKYLMAIRSEIRAMAMEEEGWDVPMQQGGGKQKKKRQRKDP